MWTHSFSSLTALSSPLDPSFFPFTLTPCLSFPFVDQIFFICRLNRSFFFSFFVGAIASTSAAPSFSVWISCSSSTRTTSESSFLVVSRGKFSDAADGFASPSCGGSSDSLSFPSSGPLSWPLDFPASSCSGWDFFFALDRRKLRSGPNFFLIFPADFLPSSLSSVFSPSSFSVTFSSFSSEKTSFWSFTPPGTSDKVLYSWLFGSSTGMGGGPSLAGCWSCWPNFLFSLMSSSALADFDESAFFLCRRKLASGLNFFALLDPVWVVSCALSCTDTSVSLPLFSTVFASSWELLACSVTPDSLDSAISLLAPWSCPRSLSKDFDLVPQPPESLAASPKSLPSSFFSLLVSRTVLFGFCILLRFGRRKDKGPAFFSFFEVACWSRDLSSTFLFPSPCSFPAACSSLGSALPPLAETKFPSLCWAECNADSAKFPSCKPLISSIASAFNVVVSEPCVSFTCVSLALSSLHFSLLSPELRLNSLTFGLISDRSAIDSTADAASWTFSKLPSTLPFFCCLLRRFLFFVSFPASLPVRNNFWYLPLAELDDLSAMLSANASKQIFAQIPLTLEEEENLNCLVDWKEC